MHAKLVKGYLCSGYWMPTLVTICGQVEAGEEKKSLLYCHGAWEANFVPLNRHPGGAEQGTTRSQPHHPSCPGRYQHRCWASDTGESGCQRQLGLRMEHLCGVRRLPAPRFVAGRGFTKKILDWVLTWKMAKDSILILRHFWTTHFLAFYSCMEF